MTDLEVPQALTMADMAVMCLTGGLDGECREDGNSPPEDHPRWCDGCEHGRAGLLRLYGDLPKITYQPGWLFRWSCANGHLFLHTIVGEPNAKGYCSVTGRWRGPGDWMWITELPLDVAWLARRIAQMEHHERREWLQIDGDAPLYPHCRHDGSTTRLTEDGTRALCGLCDGWYDIDSPVVAGRRGRTTEVTE